MLSFYGGTVYRRERRRREVPRDALEYLVSRARLNGLVWLLYSSELVISFRCVRLGACEDECVCVL